MEQIKYCKFAVICGNLSEGVSGKSFEFEYFL